MENRIKSLTPGEAWEGYVGDQSVEEFVEHSREAGQVTPQEMAEDYVRNLPVEPDSPLTDEERDTLAKKLAEYIEANTAQDPTYYSIGEDRNERELTPETVKAIWESSETEQRGHAVYDVEEIIVEDQDGERKLWAYRIGDTWTTVPAAFESMTIHWVE